MKPLVFKTKDHVRIFIPTYTGTAVTIYVRAQKTGRETIATFEQTEADLEIHEARTLIKGMEKALAYGKARGGKGGRVPSEFNDNTWWFYANSDYKVGLRNHRILVPALGNVYGPVYRRILKAVGEAVKFSEEIGS